MLVYQRVIKHSKPLDCMILHGIVWQHIFRQLPGFRSHCWVLVKGHCNHKGDLMRSSEVGTYYCKYVQTSGDSHPVQRLFSDFPTSTHQGSSLRVSGYPQGNQLADPLDCNKWYWVLSVPSAVSKCPLNPY